MMHDLIYPYRPHNVTALAQALRDYFGDLISGMSSSVADGIRVHFHETPHVEQAEAAQAIIDQHDPVWLSVEKWLVTAGGIDEAICVVRAGQVGALPVTVTINGDSIDSVAVEVDFSESDIQTVEISSLDPQTIRVFIDAPNRSHDTVEIRVV